MENFFRKLSWKVNVIVYGLLLLIMFAPLLSVAISLAMAGICDCEVSEANPSPCIVLGVDIGGLLNKMFVAGWLFLLTIFYGSIAVVLYTIYIVIGYLSHKNKS